MQWALEERDAWAIVIGLVKDPLEDYALKKGLVYSTLTEPELYSLRQELSDQYRLEYLEWQDSKTNTTDTDKFQEFKIQEKQQTVNQQKMRIEMLQLSAESAQKRYDMVTKMASDQNDLNQETQENNENNDDTEENENNQMSTKSMHTSKIPSKSKKLQKSETSKTSISNLRELLAEAFNDLEAEHARLVEAEVLMEELQDELDSLKLSSRGRIRTPRKLPPTDKMSEYTKGNAKAMNLLHQCLGPEYAELIRHKTRAVDAWQQLEDEMNKKSALVKRTAINDYNRFIYRPGKTIKEHVARFRLLNNVMSDLQIQEPEDQQCYRLLQSLPSMYEVDADMILYTFNGRPMEVESVIEMLKDKAKRRRHWDKPVIMAKSREGGGGRHAQLGRRQHSSMEAANAATTSEAAHSSSRNHPQRDRSKDLCHNCGQPGHYARECRRRQGDTPRTASANAAVHEKDYVLCVAIAASASVAGPQTLPRASPACGRCNGVGHASHECQVSAKTGTALSQQCRTTPDAKDVWLLDSGATAHVCFNPDVLTDLRVIDPITVTVASNHSIQVTKAGTAMLEILDRDGKVAKFRLREVLYSPEFRRNLLSVPCLIDAHVMVSFNRTHAKLTLPDFRIVRIPRRGDLYVVDPPPPQNWIRTTESHSAFVVQHNGADIETWHRRLAHVNVRSLKCLIPTLDGEVHDCATCHAGKDGMISMPKTSSGRRLRPNELIHADLCGPFQPVGIDGTRYMLTIVDDATRFKTIYLLSSKRKSIDSLRSYISHVERVHPDCPVVTIRTDNGGEFTAHEWREWCRCKGIEHQLTLPHKSAQNGVVERAHRTLTDGMRCLLNDKTFKVDARLWPCALRTVVHVRNRVPAKPLPNNMTPFEAFYGRKPDFGHLRTFGCTAWVVAPTQSKLSSKTFEGQFVGYSSDRKAYRVLTYDGRIVESRDVRFDETRSPSWRLGSEVSVDTTVRINDSNEPDEADDALQRLLRPRVNEHGVPSKRELRRVANLKAKLNPSQADLINDTPTSYADDTQGAPSTTKPMNVSWGRRNSEDGWGLNVSDEDPDGMPRRSKDTSNTPIETTPNNDATPRRSRSRSKRKTKPSRSPTVASEDDLDPTETINDLPHPATILRRSSRLSSKKQVGHTAKISRAKMIKSLGS